MTAPAIRVGLVDDQALIREGLRQLLERAPNVLVVLEAPDGAQARTLLREVPVDVLLLDVRMPVMGGLDLLRVLAAEQALPPTLILTTFSDDEALLQAVQLGARGFVLKDVSFTQLLADVMTVAHGGMVLRPMTLTDAGSGGAAGHAVAADLSDREREVLRLLASGYSNRELATLTGLKEGTVKNYVSTILLKLGARDRTNAVLRALELGLI